MIISKIFESKDQYDYGVCDNKEVIDFVIRVIPSKKTISFYKDTECSNLFYIIDMDLPGHEEKPTDEDLAKSGVPRGAFIVSAYNLKKALLQGIFPQNFNQFS